MMHSSRAVPVPTKRGRIARRATTARTGWRVTLAAALLLAAPATAAAKLTAVTAAGNIVISRDDGSALRILVRHAAGPHTGDGGFAQISPNGRLVAVSTLTGSAFYRVAGGTRVRTSQFVGRCQWAPNSKLMVCDDGGFPREHLVVVNAATGRAKRLATAGRFDDQLSISPDSRRVAVTTETSTGRGERLEVITLATRKARVLRTGSFFAPAWGPTRIAFALVHRPGPFQSMDVYTVKPDGTGLRRLTRFKAAFGVTGLFPVAWSRDGRRILAGNSAPDFEADLDAWGVDVAHRTWHRIGSLSATAISRDGRFVIGQTGDAEKTGIDRSDVVRASWQGNNPPKVLFHHAWGASWNR